MSGEAARRERSPSCRAMCTQCVPSSSDGAGSRGSPTAGERLQCCFAPSWPPAAWILELPRRCCQRRSSASGRRRVIQPVAAERQPQAPAADLRRGLLVPAGLASAAAPRCWSSKTASGWISSTIEVLGALLSTTSGRLSSWC